MRIQASVLLAVTITVFTACGADDGPPASSDRGLPSIAATEQNDPSDGRLTTKDGDVITDFGDRQDRQTAVETLNRLQKDFRAGRMAAACAKINDFLLSQFTPAGTEDETPCPKKLEAYAAARARRGDRPERLQLLWVRSYTTESGVWVDDAQGERYRIQLTNVDGGLKLDLGALGRPGLLAAKLVGADAYSTR